MNEHRPLVLPIGVAIFLARTGTASWIHRSDERTHFSRVHNIRTGRKCQVQPVGSAYTAWSEEHAHPQSNLLRSTEVRGGADLNSNREVGGGRGTLT